MILFLFGVARAGDATSLLEFAPWNGASLSFNDSGGALDAALSGPLGDAWSLAGHVAVPFDLSNPTGTGAYSFDVTIEGATSAERVVCKNAGLTTDQCDIVFADPTKSPAGPGTFLTAQSQMCEQLGITIAAAPAGSKDATAGCTLDTIKGKLASLAASSATSPIDDLAAGTGYSSFNLGAKVTGKLDRFSAYADASSAVPGAYGNSEANADFRLAWRVQAKKAGDKVSGGWGGYLNAGGTFSSAYMVDAADPERVVLAGSPTTLVGFNAQIGLWGVLGAGFHVDQGQDELRYVPTLALETTFTAPDAHADSILTAARFGAIASAGVRPTGSNGVGLTVGVRTDWAPYSGEHAWTITPIATVSGEIPNLTSGNVSKTGGTAVAPSQPKPTADTGASRPGGETGGTGGTDTGGGTGNTDGGSGNPGVVHTGGGGG